MSEPNGVAVEEMLVAWQRLDVKAGDILVAMVPGRLSHEQRMRVREQLVQHTQTLGVKILLLEDGITLASVRPAVVET